MTTQIFINGFDYTDAFRNATGSYSGSSLGGLYVVSAEVILSATPNINKPFDDRYNSDFGRGKEISILLDGEKAPIVGSMYVLSSRFDPNTHLVRISASCILGLVNSRTPEDLAICVRAEVGVTAQEAVDLLLDASGVTNKEIIITNNQKLLEPLLLGGSQGLISRAADICKASGYYLYQDKNGKVLTDLAAPVPSGLNGKPILRELIDAERLTDVEVPYTKIIVRGTTSEIQELGEETVLDGETTITRDFEKRTITSRTEKPNGDIVEVISTYELPSLEPATGIVANPTECLPPDEGRLIERITRFYENSVKAFSACISAHDESAIVAEADAPFFINDTLIIARTVEETWEYDIDSTDLADNKTLVLDLLGSTQGEDTTTASPDRPQKITYNRKVRTPKGIAAPIVCHWTLGNNQILTENPGAVLPPNGVINTTTVEEETIVWQKELGATKWTSKRLLERSDVLVNPEKFTSRAFRTSDVTVIPFSRNGLFTSIPIEEESKEDDTPNDPGRFPTKYTVQESDYQRTYLVNGFGSSGEAKIKTINLDLFGEVDVTTERVARANALQSWGKNKGSRLSSTFYSVQKPLEKVSIYDAPDSLAPYNIEHYYVDSPAISIDLENFAFSGVGLFISATNGAIPSEALVNATGQLAYNNGTDFTIYTYSPSAVDLATLTFNGAGWYSDSEGNQYFSDGTNTLALTVSSSPTFTPVATVANQGITVNSSGEPVQNGTVLSTSLPNGDPLVTDAQQNSTLGVEYQSSTFSQELTCARGLNITRFQVAFRTTSLADSCQRSLGFEFTPSIPVIGSNALLPWIDEENNAMISFIGN